MLRCHKCGGAAHPALAHLHGLSVPLCKSCTDAVVAHLQEVKVEETLRKVLLALAREAVSKRQLAA